MNWDHLYGSARRIVSGASWMLEKLRELHEDGKSVSPWLSEAKTLVGALDHVASNDVLIEVRNLFDAVVVAPVATPAPGSDPLAAPAVTAQRIVDLLNEATHPIGEFIQKLNANEQSHFLGMLLMSGMTGIYKNTKAITDELEELLRC